MRELPWQTELDAKKDLVQVHNNNFRQVLGEDFKLAKFEEKDVEHILNLLGAGTGIIGLCPNPDVARDMKDMVFTYLNGLAVLRFNRHENMIVDRIANWNPEQQGDEDKDFKDRLLERLESPLKEKKRGMFG